MAAQVVEHAIPLLIPLIVEAARVGVSRLSESAEKERLVAEVDKMTDNIEQLELMREQCQIHMAEMESANDEKMRKRDEKSAEEEQKLKDEILAMRAEFARTAKEMENATKEEKVLMKAYYDEQIKAREDERIFAQREAKKERDEMMKAHEAEQKKQTEYERKLQDRRLEQAKHHSDAISLLHDKYGVEVKQLQERAIEREKEHGKEIAGLHVQHLEDDRAHSERLRLTMLAHFCDRDSRRLADKISRYREHHSSLRSYHLKAIGELFTAAADQQNLVAIGTAIGCLDALDSCLRKFDYLEDDIFAALQGASSVPLTARDEQKSCFAALAQHRDGYCTQATILSAKLSRHPPASISDSEVERLNGLFEQLSSGVRAIPLLPITDGVAQIAAACSEEVQAMIEQATGGQAAIGAAHD